MHRWQRQQKAGDGPAVAGGADFDRSIDVGVRVVPDGDFAGACLVDQQVAVVIVVEIATGVDVPVVAERRVGAVGQGDRYQACSVEQ